MHVHANTHTQTRTHTDTHLCRNKMECIQFPVGPLAAFSLELAPGKYVMPSR